MDCALIPSLESIAVIGTVIAFWSQDDIRDLIAKLYFPRLSFRKGLHEWQRIEDKVLKQMSKLLPKLLKTKTINIYKEIGLQIVKWIKYHEAFLSERRVVRESLNRLSWTSQGLIDRKKTAKILIKDEILNINARYVLACVYCLEDDIPKLWDKIPKDDRALFCYQKNLLKIHQWDLVVVWTHDLKGEITNLNLWEQYEFEHNLDIRYTAYQYAFEYAAEGGNRAAAEYFLQKVAPEVRRLSILRAAKNIAEKYVFYPRRHGYSYPVAHSDYYYEECCADVVRFLLSQMNGMEKSIKAGELRFLLDWPFQNTFLKIVSRLWCFLSQSDFIDLLLSIIRKLRIKNKNPKYRKLLREFWEQSPTTHKRSVLNQMFGRAAVIMLVSNEEESDIKFIFKDLTEGRKNFICSYLGLTMCSYLIYHEKWDLIDFFIRECLPSKDDIINFQQANKLFLLQQFSVSEEKWNRLCQRLNNIVCGYDKRKNVEEGNGSSIKKFCSENENCLI